MMNINEALQYIHSVSWTGTKPGLARVAELTGGDSLASNIQLVLNNAALAARTASAYSRQR